MHELVTVLEEFGYTWFSLDRAYEGLTYRPDGVVHVVVDSSVIFVEVDERGHDPLHPSYTPLKEQTRLGDLAMVDNLFLLMVVYLLTMVPVMSSF